MIRRAVLMANGDEIGPNAILWRDSVRLDESKPAAVGHAALAAEAVTRSLVGCTVADVERDLILETLKHCLGNARRIRGRGRPHSAPQRRGARGARDVA